MLFVKWLLAAIGLFVSAAAQAQTCGPDSPPSQAAAAGLTCEIFRWCSAGSTTSGAGRPTCTGDTISEIAGPSVTAPGFKWYLSLPGNAGYTPAFGDITFTGGKMTIQAHAPLGSDSGMWELNVCGNGPQTITHGWNQTANAQLFSGSGGYYIETIEEWNGTGGSTANGKPGAYGTSIEAYTNTGFNGHGIEVDNIDGLAFNQAMIDWNGGSNHQFGNTGTPPTYPTIETGNSYGVLVQGSAATWYKNDTSWGTVNFDLGGEPAFLLSTHLCWGLMATSQFPVTVDSVRLWVPQSVPTAGSIGRWRHGK